VLVDNGSQAEILFLFTVE
jgi:hypothetical protein